MDYCEERRSVSLIAGTFSINFAAFENKEEFLNLSIILVLLF